MFLQELSKEVADAPGKVVAKKCDVSKEEEILALYDNIKAEYGGADVCINNAGLSHVSPLLSGQTEDWREIMEVAFTYINLYVYIIDSTAGELFSGMYNDKRVCEAAEGEEL